MCTNKKMKPPHCVEEDEERNTSDGEEPKLQNGSILWPCIGEVINPFFFIFIYLFFIF